MSFRQVDIDRLDPDSVVNYVPEITPSGVTLADVQQVSATVKSHIQSGAGPAALQAAVANPPFGSDEATKDAALKNVLTVLGSLRVSDIEGAVKGLSPAERVTLVKYIYKAMGTTQGKQNGGILLNWLERTVSIVGQGVIIRHISDRRQV